MSNFNFTFDDIQAEWMTQPQTPVSEVTTVVDPPLHPVGQCFCNACVPPSPSLQEAVEAVQDSAGAALPLIITPQKIWQDSPRPSPECDIASFKENVPLAPSRPISKVLSMEMQERVSQLGKRSLEEELTLREPEVLQSSVASIAPKKKRAKKAPNPLNGENSQIKVIEKIGCMRGHYFSYKCIDKNDMIFVKNIFVPDDYPDISLPVCNSFN